MSRFRIGSIMTALLVLAMVLAACGQAAPTGGAQATTAPAATTAAAPAATAAAPATTAPAPTAAEKPTEAAAPTAAAEKPTEAAAPTAMAEATAAPEAGGAQAGVAKNPPDKAGKPITILDVPKLIGIGYFAATTKGMQEAATELGNVTAKTDGPTEAKIEKQIEFIDNDISQQPDAIVFAANDPVAISPVLKKALDAGIHVVGYDAGSQDDAREWFVNQATFEGIGKALVDEMVKQTGEEADVAIVTSSLTAPNQNKWIDEMKKYIAASHPKLNIVTTLPSEEDQQLAFKAAQDIMKSYPNVKGIFGMSSVAFPGATDAVKQAGNCGKIAVVGLSTPNQMRPFMKEGCIKSVVLWNPVDLGYATVYAVRALVDGKLKPGATELDAGRLGKLKITGSEILLGPPFVFTPENIDKFDF
jgi:rhamnose transport system substrate-binding protein